MPNAMPRFPLTVHFSGGEEMVIENRSEIETELEWLNTEDTEDPVQVIDADGRPVRLVVEFLEIKVLALESSPAASGSPRPLSS